MNFSVIIPLAVVVFANVLYHIASKGIPGEQNAFMGLIVNYGVAFILSVVMFFVMPHNSPMTELLKTNWAAVTMGLSVVGLEAGFIFAYRNGGEISVVALIANILFSLMLLPIGVMFYGEAMTATKIIGAILCIVGIIFISV